MNHIKFHLTVLFSMILVGCGGGGDNVPAKPKFSSQVSFGDSLSDVGTYKVGTVFTLGGGQFTINGTVPTNWTELTAFKLGLPAPCPAVTGLNGDLTLGFNVSPTTHAGCTGYAQGGSRVTDPHGLYNSYWPDSASQTIGMLTYPVVTQMQNYLASMGGAFNGSELVFVMAGANDVFIQLQLLKAGATAAATAAVTAAVPGQIATDIASRACVPADVQATNCQPAAVATLIPTVGAAAANTYLTTNAPIAVAAIGTAAAELVNDINTLLLEKGAKYVTVANVPDIGTTPFASGLDSSSKNLLNTMIATFNTTLKSGLDALPDQSSLLYVDANAASHDETVNPASYNLTNVTNTACNLTQPSPNPLASSLVCNALNLNSGVLATDHYLFADTVHPTPYGYSLFATYVLQAMTNKGWY